MAPPIECDLGYRFRTGTLNPNLNPNPKTDPDSNPNPKSNNNLCSSDVKKTFFVKTKTKTLGLKTKTSIFFQDQDQDQDFFFQDQDQDFTRTTEQVTISWSQNEQNSIHMTRIAVYEIKTVGLM